MDFEVTTHAAFEVKHHTCAKANFVHPDGRFIDLVVEGAYMGNERVFTLHSETQHETKAQTYNTLTSCFFEFGDRILRALRDGYQWKEAATNR